MRSFRCAFLSFILFLLFILATLLLASSCQTELIRQQEEQIQQQEEEIARQKKELEELRLARQRERQKRRDCNRAFAEYFAKAQMAQDPQQAVALYRRGLDICPDDEVAHYELGKVLLRLGRTQQAEQEFEKALKLNPDLQSAKRELENLKTK